MGLETFFSPSEQTMFFLHSVLMGVCLGVLFDCFRVIRIILPHTTFVVVFEDIIFIFLWAVAVLVFSMEMCRGEVRFYYFIGNVLGFTLYLITVGKIVVAAIKTIVLTIYKIFKFIYRIFIKPLLKIIVSVCQILFHAFVTIYSKLKKFMNHMKKYLKDKHKMLYNVTTHKKLGKRKKREVKRLEKGRRKKTKEKHRSA